MAKSDGSRAQLLMNKAEQELWVFSGLMQLSIPPAGARNSKVLLKYITTTATTTGAASRSSVARCTALLSHARSLVLGVILHQAPQLLSLSSRAGITEYLFA
jgi:hypothetical protein